MERISGRTQVAPLLAALPLNPQAHEPLHRQLCDHLREAILSGRLGTGTRLPGTRTLATELGVSRNTVLSAFEQLIAEGYVTGKVGAGTYVACLLPDALLQVSEDAFPATTTVAQRPVRQLSRRGERIAGANLLLHPAAYRLHAFRPGVPALDAFPQALWTRLMARRWRKASSNMLSYNVGLNYTPLAEAIASHLTTARGVRCTPEQVIVVAGSQQALDMSARLLLDDGDHVLMENPGYRGARGAFVGAGAQMVPAPVDEDGMQVGAAIRACPHARVAYVSPSHQYPTGALLSLDRRLALLDWARRSDAWVLEDDYDSEYRYAGRPLSALQGLDRADRVIYIGTFSKVLLPSIRMGYVVVPPGLVEAFMNARALVSWHPPTMQQAVLADFMLGGHFTHHLRRMRTLYAERQAWLLEALQRYADGLLNIDRREAGMQLTAWLPPGVDDMDVFTAALEENIYVHPVSSECIEPLPRGGIVLGYAALTRAQIFDGAQRLARALERVVCQQARP